MKKIIRVILFAGIIVGAFSGCGKQGSSISRVNNTNNVDKVINEQVNAENMEEQRTETETNDNVIDSAAAQQSTENNAHSDTAIETGDVDIDLTAMGSDMVYATVYQLMTDPDAYIGKTIRMNGTYNATYYEPTQKYYHYCIIKDATACCAKGIEFVWDDGSHVYPDEYPDDEADIVITGIFETYREEGDSNLYCRLRDTILEVNEEH